MNNKKIILDKDELYQKYITEGLSQKKTSEYFGCSIDTIVRNLKEYGIESHICGSWAQSNLIKLNNFQKEIINGAMLGDGSLHIHKKGVNAQFCYTSKSLQHVEFVTKEFLQYSYKEGVKKYSHNDKRTNKTYDRYTFRTISDKGLTDLYNKWYINKVKHIPTDLVLTQITCLIWYIGDGCIYNSSKHNGQYIKLATNCFTKEEQENILIPQLKQFDARLNKVGKSKNTGEYQYAIFIPRKYIKDFLNYIGECPFDDYAYKWDIKEIKKISYTQYYSEWEEKYKAGIKYYKIAKEYNADPTTVLAHLQRVGIYKKFEGYKQFYKEWEERYLNGESFYEISKDYNCHHKTVLHHLRKVKIYKEKGVIQDGHK